MKRIAWVSPLSPLLTSAAARYSQTLLPVLAEQVSIEVFVDDVQGALASTPRSDLPIRHFHRLAECDRREPFDYFVYQIEDSVSCNFVRLCAAVWPGFSCFHDRNLNNLYYGLYRHTTAPTELNNLIEEKFGSRAPRLGDYHVRGWSAEIFDSLYACGETELQQAVVVGVFNEYDRRAAERQRDGAPVVGLTRPPSAPRRTEQDLMRYREAFGISNDVFCLGFAPRSYLADRVIPTLSGFQIFRDKLANRQEAVLLWLCSDEAEFALVEKVQDRFPELFENVRAKTVSSYDELLQGLAASNVVSALRFDRKRAEPVSARAAMDMGVPTILSSLGPGEVLSQHALAVPVGQGEESMLAAVLYELATDGSFAAEAAARGQAYVSDTFSISRAVASLQDGLLNHHEVLAAQLQAARTSVNQAMWTLLSTKTDSLDEMPLGELRPSALLQAAAVDFHWVADA